MAKTRERVSALRVSHQRQFALGVPAFAKGTARSRRSSQAKSRAEGEGPSANEKKLVPAKSDALDYFV